LIAVPPLICATLVFFYRINVKGEGLETVEAELTGTGTQKRRAAPGEPGRP